MFTGIRSATGAACLALSALAGTSAHATNYNVVVFGDFTGQSSDVEGALAGGGNITLSAYEIGAKLGSASNAQNTLVAGRSIAFSNGQLDHGSAVAPSIDGDFYAGHGTKTTGSALNFAALKAQYTASSNAEAGLAANGSTTSQSGTMTLTGALPGLNVFDITGSDLASVGVFSLNIPTGAAALINISGSSASFLDMDFQAGGTSASNILFNFGGNTLNLGGIGFVGSILAPAADVNFSNGHLDGQLIANSLSGAGQTGQINNYQLNAVTFFPSASAFALAIPAPEPATWMLLIGGFGAIGRMLRRRHAALSSRLTPLGG